MGSAKSGNRKASGKPGNKGGGRTPTGNEMVSLSMPCDLVAWLKEEQARRSLPTYQDAIRTLLHYAKLRQEQESMSCE